MNISKKTLFLIPSILVLAISMVTLLAWRSLEPLNNTKFNRTFISARVTEESAMSNEGITALSGSTKTHLFFQTKDPDLITMTDYNFKNRSTIKLKIPKHEKMSSGFFVYVDSPNVTVLAGRLSLAIETTFNSDQYSLYKFPTTIFTHSTKIGPNSYVIRGVDTLVKRFDQILIKANLITKKIKRENDISETNKDGGISTDGALTYDPATNSIVYVQYYEDKIMRIDSNMNLVFTKHTIDNSKSFPIRSTVNKNVLTSSTPKRLVNNESEVYGGYLFNYSVIKGENETIKTFNNNSTLDLYEIKTGAYKGSFYVPRFKDERMQRFSVIDNRIIAFYKSHVVVYNFSLPQLLN
jgi:hypothetical protein